MKDNQVPADMSIRYMDGELTGEELIAFETALQQSDALKAELENLMLARKVAEHYGLRQQVSLVHRQMTSEPKIRPLFSLSYILRIVAIFVFCVLAFSTYQYISLSASSILPAAAVPYNLNTERGTVVSSQIEQAYRQQNYASVISEFEAASQPGVMEQFLAAQAYRALHQPVKAITVLKSINGMAPAAAYQDDIEYYLGLSYLEDNQPSAAYVWLEKIHASKDHLYHDRVDDLSLFKLKLYILKSGK